MSIAVLLKAVPDVDTLRFDPSSRSVVRDGAELFLNPFDQRALRVALELARPSEPVVALSLGPPHARLRLAEARALGATTARLLTDPRFAGSDVLATARTLAAVLAREPPDLVLAGARSTDSDTGLVGPEVGELLGLTVVTDARALRRTGPDGGFEAIVDTPRGWAKVTFPSPALVTVGEKIAKPLRLEPGRAEAAVGRVEQLDLGATGLAPDQVGATGSPTRVSSVRDAAPSRAARIFSEGSPADRVSAAVAELAPLLRAPPVPPPPLRPPPPRVRPDREVALLATDADGGLDRGMLGWFSEIRRISGEHWPSAVWVGPDPAPRDVDRLSRAGALAGYRIPLGRGRVDARLVASGLVDLLGIRPALAAVGAPSEPFGREVAGRVAAARGLGAIGDATSIEAPPTGSLAFVKPSFGGRTLATIESRTRPAVVTLRPSLAPVGEASGPPLSWDELSVPSTSSTIRLLERGEDPEPLAEPEGRDVVVAVGLGVGGPDGVARATAAAERWGAAVVGTRKIVDAGWLPARLQLGLTGRALAPRLAVLLGVRGSANHMVGWRRAGALLAVNSDPTAAVFSGSDVGIVGTVEETVPLLLEPLARTLGT